MKLRVSAENGSYDINIGGGLISADILSGYPNYAVITDENVFKLYGSLFDAKRTIVLPPGEESKNFENLKMILERLLDMGLTRNDAVVALGGGVVGDIAGFAAAVYKRGARFVQIPTTLLAQVDSSVGGKVAVNLEGGKNMAGVFYQPEVVIADTAALDSLDKRQYAAGMAEVIKYAYIADAELYIKLKEGGAAPEDIIRTCCAIKAKIVEQDPYDHGLRMILNYGHTIGHAIETAAGYGKYLHGEAVALGMVYAALIGERLGISPEGLMEDTKALVSQYDLPYTIEDDALKNALRYISADKKADADGISFIFINKVGSAVIEKVKTDKILNILGELAL